MRRLAGQSALVSRPGCGEGFTAKLEYLYLDLGTYTDTFVIPAAAAGNTVTTTSTSHFTDHILRVGLNYKFDWGLGLVQY